MSAERHGPEQHNSHFYYGANGEMAKKLIEHLYSYGFETLPFGDPVLYGIVDLQLVDENGYGVTMFPDLERPEQYFWFEVDRELVNLIEDMDLNLELDLTQNQIAEDLINCRELIDLAPPGPNPDSFLHERTYKDEFAVWENMLEEEVQELKRHIKKHYPNFQHITNRQNSIFPDNFEVYRASEDVFIVIAKQVNTDHPNKYRVKSKKEVEPILSDFWGPPNSPPISYQ